MSPFWSRPGRGSRRASWLETVFWALDLETSGLDVQRDEILAIGMVPIRSGSIRWGERFSALVQPRHPDAPLGSGFHVHQLLPGEVAQGLPLGDAVAAALERLAEGVLLVHFAALDVSFLRRACATAGRIWPKPPVVDTVRLLERMATMAYPRQQEGTSLGAARARFGLPPANEHDALDDALATAELFLLLRQRLRAETLGEMS